MAIVSLAALSGCSLDDDEGDGSSASPTPEPSPTEEIPPTPTQVAIGSPVPGYSNTEKWSGRTLTVAAWGGEYQDAQREAFFEPFMVATGATVQEKVADLESLKTQVEESTVIWDVATVPMREMTRLAKEGYLEPLNYDVIDTTLLFPDIVADFGVGASYFSTILTFPGSSSSAPTSWIDFWNAQPVIEGEETQPTEQRSLQRNPIGTLEFALLADGVEPAELYPLDLDRAFASLTRLRENVLVWWQESKEPVELVAGGQIGMASAWNSRITQLELNESLRTLWYQGMLSADAWVVPFGSENEDVAMDFINFATRAIPSANFARLVPYGPVNSDSFAFLRQDRLPLLPSAPTNKPVQFEENWSYWAENEEAVTIRFEEWLLEENAATPEAS